MTRTLVGTPDPEPSRPLMWFVTTTTLGQADAARYRTTGIPERFSWWTTSTTSGSFVSVAVAGYAVNLNMNVSSGQTVVSDPQTSIFGVGATIAEAVNDFRQAVRDFYEVLRDEPLLSPHLSLLLSRIRRYFER